MRARKLQGTGSTGSTGAMNNAWVLDLCSQVTLRAIYVEVSGPSGHVWLIKLVLTLSE